MFAPFDKSDQQPIWFLQADENVGDETNLKPLESYLEALPDVDKPIGLNVLSTSRSDYNKTFETYMSRLKTTNLDKAILSKIVSRPKTDESVLSIYNRLSETYPLAFTYLIYLPTGEMWMGATPELLVKQHKTELQTMALAGTQLLNKRIVSDVVWENKEIEEQAYVRNYVKEILSLSSDTVEVSETYTAEAGNLVHLRTDFKVNQVYDRAYALSIAEKLHPTPAVCGIPLEESKILILDIENHNREYYTGFLGPMKSDSLALFVNLRCMQILSQNYTLYVGGGITRDSDMNKEWEETEVKAQTLLAVIDSPS